MCRSLPDLSKASRVSLGIPPTFWVSSGGTSCATLLGRTSGRHTERRDMRMIQSVWVLTLALGAMGALGAGCHESRSVVDPDSGAGLDGAAPRADAGGGVDVEDYDRSCATDDECRVVFTGSPCGCSCEVSAINEDEFDAYRAAQSELRAMCEGPTLECLGCPEALARCEEEICVAVRMTPEPPPGS